jgi:hypothetical protein
MRSAHLMSATLGVLALAVPGFAADADDGHVKRDNLLIKVMSRKDITFNDLPVSGLKETVLWARPYNGSYGTWAKIATFAKGTPMVWTPTEGDWNFCLQPVLTSGQKDPDPTGNGDPAGELAKTSGEFIIDRTAPAAAITYPTDSAKLRGGDKYTITWTASDPYLRDQPVTLSYSRDGSDDHMQVIASALANTGSYDWSVPTDMTKTGRLRIAVADKAGNVGTAEVTSLLVDSIKPSGHVTGPAITATMTTVLTTSITDGGPAGLKSARLWVSTDGGTSWTEGPWIEDPSKVSWTAPADGVYSLYILAEDGAGNKSPTPSGKMADAVGIIVDTTPPLVTLDANIGVILASSPTATNQRDFKPGDRMQVPFKVKDANLAPNSARIYLQYSADGDWTELARDQPLDQVFKFAIPSVDAKAARIKVTATDLAGNVGAVVASESFTIQKSIVLEDNHGTATGAADAGHGLFNP